MLTHPPQGLPAKLQNDKSLLNMLEAVQAHLNQNNKSDALKIFNTIADKIPNDNIDLLIYAGALSQQLGKYPSAVEYFSRAVILDPTNLLALEGCGTAYLELKQLPQAAHFLLQILAINPDSFRAIYHLARIKIELRDFEAALPLLEKAIQLEPNDSSTLCYLSVVTNNLGKPEQALRYIEKAARLTPEMPGSQYLLGSMYGDLGQSEAAIACYEKGIALEPTFGSCYYGIAQEKKFSSKDAAFIKKMEKILQGQLSAEDRGYINFALGKANNDLEEWDKAFYFYQQGNLLRKPFTITPPTYKIAATLRKLYQTKHKPLTGFGNPSEAPVFIIGMPRSGSTLVEQVISSHPAATTAGELAQMTVIGDQIILRIAAESDAFFTGEYVQSQADNYLNVLRSGRERYLRIIDKSPGNFVYIGLILMLFPNARFIHTIRHPLDTCLSCYFQAFDQVAWATDLEWIADSYRYYRSTMEGWKKILPEGRIIDIHYEQLIENTEAETRRIIDACGLDWHPDCLQHNQTRGKSIRTSSSWQVRQPIYKTSRMRWTHYAPHLAVLARKLNPYLSPEDREILSQHGINPGTLWNWEAFKNRFWN